MIPILDGPLDPAWRAYANCKGCDPELFHPERGPGCVADVQAAKAVCRGCVVRGACLEYAIAAGEKLGVWGGTTDDERRAIKRQRRAAARKTAA
jgi:WhiB family redox-sensing transcriptional regulator